MIDLLSVGSKITACRKQANMTQDDLANKLYVTRQLVSKWENGTGTPSIEMLIEMSRLFQISIEELLCLNESVDIDPDDIFRNHQRLYVIQSIINKSIVVDIPAVFYQMSPMERMMILKAIKEGKLVVNKQDLDVRLTASEHRYLYE